MPNLKFKADDLFKTDELVELFPWKLKNLDLVVSINELNSLKFIFIQKNMWDRFRNWESYYEWKEKNETHINGLSRMNSYTPLPKNISPIYHKNIKDVEKGIVSKDDKMIFSIYLKDEKRISEDIVYLAYTIRNKDICFKGVGKEIYENLFPLIKSKGFNYVTAIPGKPLEKLVPYWEKNGFKHCSLCDNKIKSKLEKEKYKDVLYVRSL